MKPSPSPEHHEPDQELIKLLKELGSFTAEYPADLLAARRADFLEQVEGLIREDAVEDLSAAEEELVRRLAPLKSVSLEYPADLLAARRSAFLHQVEGAGETSVWGKLRDALQRAFSFRPTLPTLSSAGLRRISLVMVSLLIAVLIGSLFLPRTEGSFPLSAMGRHPLRTSTADLAITICRPDDQMPSCLVRELHASQDLANPGNGPARPAVSKDVRVSADRVYMAGYVNDGRSGASWVSASTDSWIKIDLGRVIILNTVSLQKGSPDPSQDSDPGQFAIAVAISDVYADGDSSNDDMEYAQIFYSEQTGFSGMVSDTETIQTRFPPVRARFVKITFEKAGTAIEEVGIFMVPPSVIAEQPTRMPEDPLPGITLSPIQTSTGFVEIPATSVPTNTWLPIDTAMPTASSTFPPAIANTLPPADTSTPLPSSPSPSDTPLPLPTMVLPTAIPPTAIQLPPPSTETILVTGNDQTFTFTCNGDAAVIRGHANTVTLLGSCSSITVTGNGNHVFWESGSPVITNRGKDNIISQL